jgi:hypothetical protein
MRQHAKGSICRGMLKNGRLDVKSHLLIDIGPITYGQVWVVSYNLVPKRQRVIVPRYQERLYQPGCLLKLLQRTYD